MAMGKLTALLLLLAFIAITTAQAGQYRLDSVSNFHNLGSSSGHGYINEVTKIEEKHIVNFIYDEIERSDLDRYLKGRYGPGSLKQSQCSGECNRRCKKTQYKKPCLFFCNKCCNKCLCVPPGYYGNKAVCPCYNNWKTKEGGPKCP